MTRPTSSTVTLRDLTESRSLHGLRILTDGSENSPVQDIALITDIEEITSVGPDTVILLTQDVARGGWMVSAALRYAWERRACALIVPENTFTDTVVELARRLGISLLSTAQNITSLALDVAIQIGVSRAGSLALLHGFAETVSHARDLETALAATALELQDIPVWIESSDAITICSAADHEHHHEREASDTDVLVRIPIAADERSSDFLVTLVKRHAQDFAQQVLRVAVPSIRALLASTRLQVIRASLPLVSITALTGLSPIETLDEPERDSIAEAFEWSIEGDYVAVCVLAHDRDRLGTAVHQVWTSEFGEIPLARFSDGWLAFVPLRSRDEIEPLVQRMRERLAQLYTLELRVGISTVRHGFENSVESVRESWLSARLASNADSGMLLEFDRVAASLLQRVIPPTLAVPLADALWPRLLADPSSDELISAVLAFLSTHGSVSRAALMLGVHRNTLQSRIRRAETLGVALADPEQVLPVHMLLTAVAASRAA